VKLGFEIEGLDLGRFCAWEVLIAVDRLVVEYSKGTKQIYHLPQWARYTTLFSPPPCLSSSSLSLRLKGKGEAFQ
jgi:hypothetical protein